MIQIKIYNIEIMADLGIQVVVREKDLDDIWSGWFDIDEFDYENSVIEFVIDALDMEYPRENDDEYYDFDVRIYDEDGVIPEDPYDIHIWGKSYVRNKKIEGLGI